MSRFGHWLVEVHAEDGGRIRRLQFDGQDLLTVSPPAFRAPVRDYGRYETRAVFGYDDCFPTVDACTYPGSQWSVPDHGELCWLNWQVEPNADRLVASVQSQQLPVTFRRQMHFEDRRLRWTFQVDNAGPAPLPFLHVMHPLMPLEQVSGVELPNFAQAYNEIAGAAMNEKTPEEIQRFLLTRPQGTASMLLLRGVTDGRFRIALRGGISLAVEYPAEMFPSLGIWWNNRGYPDEEGLRRSECAVEPISGPTSRLSDGTVLVAPPGKKVTWNIDWEIV